MVGLPVRLAQKEPIEEPAAAPQLPIVGVGYVEEVAGAAAGAASAGLAAQKVGDAVFFDDARNGLI
jgi:hypothetical protein